MGTQDILCETLFPLDAAYVAAGAPEASELEPDVVIRNQISLSAGGGPLPDSAVLDYLSLDVNDVEDRAHSVLATPLPPPPSPPRLVENSNPVAERTLDGECFRDKYRFKSSMFRLHKEILDFCDFLSPMPEEQESRNAAINSVSDVIKYIWPSAEVKVFGSFKTGLHLPSSDIDVVILGSNVRSPQMGLYALARALSERGIAKKIQVIGKARVPIIKFVEKRSSVAFDISFDAENGPKATEYIKDAVSKWPQLKPLCLILKFFLQQRELNEVYTGGIGSHALLSMLISMLRAHHDRQASPEHNLGILLVSFFDMYGCKLNTVDVGVACNGTAVFFSKSSKRFSDKCRPSLIAIEDPQAPDNDIGKSSFNYHQARSAFATAFATLTNSKAIARLGPDKSILSTIIRPDAMLFERKGGLSSNLALGPIGPLDHLHGNRALLNNEAKSPGKKRKASKKNKMSEKLSRLRGPGHV